jgi:hypothetical protein
VVAGTTMRNAECGMRNEGVMMMKRAMRNQ